MAKKLMKGCEAIGEAAIQSGCRLFFGYPITPQNEIPEYMSARMPQVGGVFVQAESEVAASNMLYGAAGAGRRCFTSSSSPGISLMQEAISYLAGAELPVVIVNIMRAGPGLGGILPSQSDYLQATKGGGHGDYRVLVLAPSTVQEAADLTMEAFDLADKYRNPVMILGDGLIGQMMEPVEFKRRIEPETCRRSRGPRRATWAGRRTSSTRFISGRRTSSSTTWRWARSTGRWRPRSGTRPIGPTTILRCSSWHMARWRGSPARRSTTSARRASRWGCSGRSRSSRTPPRELPEKPWATTGNAGRAPNIVNSLYLRAEDLEQHNLALGAKYRAMEAEVRHETYRTDDDLDVLIVAYGTVARIARTSIDSLREKGLKVGLFRPVTLFPYPSAALAAAAARAKHVLVAELSMGQMVEDVRAVVAGRVPVDFFGRCGGMVMTAEELAEQAEKLVTVPA